jgi:hypothetical protein
MVPSNMSLTVKQCIRSHAHLLETSQQIYIVLAHDTMFAVIQKLYLEYGSGEFDGQGSGHDFYGTLFHPPHGYVNNCDGGRSHLSCDVILSTIPRRSVRVIPVLA